MQQPTKESGGLNLKSVRSLTFCMATWGVCTGLLGVVTTVLKQSGHLH
jgi:hypothetical protein